MNNDSPLGRAIGCAGWSIASKYQDLFGPGDSMLARYATRFSVVEINSSFYRPHMAKTYQRWSDSVPAGFRFSVKIPREISHELALRSTTTALERFLGEVQGLGEKLAGFLLQLPPSLIFDGRTPSNFFRLLRARSDVPVACEPRHRSWFSEKATSLLVRYAIDPVFADPSPVPIAQSSVSVQRWRYWRLHGSPRIYYSSYSDKALQYLASELSDAREVKPSQWVIFDNTAHGFSIPNAMRLKALLDEEGKADSIGDHRA